MSFLSRKGFLDAVSICIQAKRFRGKINIQRPQKPHFERALYFEVGKPFLKKRENVSICTKDVKIFNRNEQENPLQNIIAREMLQRFKSSRLIAFYHLNPMAAELQYKAYVMFKRENMDYKNYGRRTLEIAIKGTPYERVLDFYVSHNMIVFSPEVQIKKLLKINKKFPQIVLLAGIMDGKFVSKDELVYYSNIPNLQTAQAELVQTLSGIGSNIVNQLNTHQQILVSQLSERMKQLEDNKEDK